MKSLVALMLVVVIVVGYNIWIGLELQKATEACMARGNTAHQCAAAQRGHVQ